MSDESDSEEFNFWDSQRRFSMTPGAGEDVDPTSRDDQDPLEVLIDNKRQLLSSPEPDLVDEDDNHLPSTRRPRKRPCRNASPKLDTDSQADDISQLISDHAKVITGLCNRLQPQMEEQKTLQDELKRCKVNEDEVQKEAGSLKEEIRDLRVEIEDLKGDIVYLVKTQKDAAHRIEEAEQKARKVKQMNGEGGVELEDIGRRSRGLSSPPQSA